MAAPLPTEDVLGVFKALKDDIQATVLAPRGLSIKSAGTKKLPLGEPVSTAAGFWENPHSISGKPPRWILQVEGQNGGDVAARFALDAAGHQIGMSRTIGYINNRDGTCAVCAFRIMPAVKPAGAAVAWEFPDKWEYLLVVAFNTPLPAGTSGDPLIDFDPVAGTLAFGGGAARATYPLAFRAVVKAPVAPASTAAAGTTYDNVGAAVAHFLGATLYDGTQDAERDRLVAEVAAVFALAPVQAPFALAEDTTLVGIDSSVYRQIEAAVNSGKRHIIFYGPPGTGKTTLAEYLAREVSERDDGDGSYLMLTASAAWSQQDLVGGYQPLGGGAIGFIPGALLRNFDKPVIIDELNRCPIDKVLGPMFSILSGQSSVLPCRVDAADTSSPFHIVHPTPRPGMAGHEHAPQSAWRLICTLNTYDKTQLGQISYALSRRFAWIKIGAPADPDLFVSEMVARIGVAVPTPIPVNPIGAMWRAINAVREIGGAPIVDFIKTVRALDLALDLFALPANADAETFLSAFRMCVLPLMDGLSPREASDLAASIATEWALSTESAERLARDCAEFSA
jgi:MoxR-like ATPase